MKKVTFFKKPILLFQQKLKKLKLKRLLYFIYKEVKRFNLKSFKLYKKQIKRFPIKHGKVMRIIKTYKLFYTFTFNVKKLFQKSINKIENPKFISQLFFYFQNKFNQKLKQLKKKLKTKKFLKKFYFNKLSFIRHLFFHTFYSFSRQLRQVQVLFKDFPLTIMETPPEFFDKQRIYKYFNMLLAKYGNILNIENFKLIKLEFASLLKKIVKNPKIFSKSIRFINNNIFFVYLNKIINKIKIKKNQELNTIFDFKLWMKEYKSYLTEKIEDLLTGRYKKNKAIAANVRLLKEKFQNSLTRFNAFKKSQEKFIPEKKIDIFMPNGALIHRFKTMHKDSLNYLFRKISLIKFNHKYKKYLVKKLKNKRNLIKLKPTKFSLFNLLSKLKNSLNPEKKNNNFIKLSFLSTRFFSLFVNNFLQLKKKLNLKSKNKTFMLSLLNISNKYKKFIFAKLKQNIIFKKKISTHTNFSAAQPIHNLNILKNKTILVKSKFNRYIQTNSLFYKMNLLQNLEVTNLLQNTSDILRAESFRNLINKEDAYYQTFYKKQNPLQLLTTITGHNIYLTLFISKPYQILWKASSGMLGLKKFRRAKRHQTSFKDLLLRCQLFMARNRVLLQRPLHLVLRYLNYYGTRNFLSVFLRQKKPNSIFQNYKNIKLYHFYRNAKHLCNNYIFQFMSMIWSRLKNNYKNHYYNSLHTLIQHSKNSFKAFPEVSSDPKHISSTFVVVRPDNQLKHYLKKNPFIIK